MLRISCYKLLQRSCMFCVLCSYGLSGVRKSEPQRAPFTIVTVVQSPIFLFTTLHFNLRFTLVIIATDQSTNSLDYITINLGKLNDTKPTVLKVRHSHIDLTLQGFVLLQVVFIIGTLHTTSVNVLKRNNFQ